MRYNSVGLQKALFTLTIFLNSALLFLVQPLVARIILPVYGGSPAVWTASMVFFQAFLLLGYAYAHVSTRLLAPRIQAWLHVGVLAIAALTLPFGLPSWSGAIGSSNPTLLVLGTLAVMVGATFFAVSAGAPLIQRWFSSTDAKDAKDPYFLYSSSNIGSLLALLAYPFLLEPSFRLREQAGFWGFGYGLLILLMGVCALSLRRAPATIERVAAPALTSIAWRQRLLWIALAAVPSSLLLGVTSFLTTNIAPVPLLWVVPLSLYLLTYILAFALKPLLSATTLGRVAPLLATPLILVILLESDKPIFMIGGFHLATFFLLAWMCHRRLVESRPESSHLTEFYLWISVGGVVGGLFNAAAAPVLFSKLYEYPLAVVLALMLRPRIAELAPKLWQRGLAAGIVGLTLAGVLLTKAGGMDPGAGRTLLSIGIPLMLTMILMDWPILAAAAMGGVVASAVLLGVSSDAQVVLTRRSFFGVHRVSRSDDGRFHRLIHGNTIHGMQDKQNPSRSLTYYHPTGPVGNIFKAYKGELKRKDIALVGLGVGSIAAFGEPGQRMTYFEIDQTVLDIAQDPALFTFLRDSRADLDFVLGDARLTLAKQPDQSYDLLLLDAFSSDAIPIHLLTVEAFQTYLMKLKPGGVIAVHISNRYLNLQPVLRAAAKHLKLQAVLFEDGVTQDEADEGKTPSIWVAMGRTEADIAPLLRDRNWSELYENPVRVWTDDYSNVLGSFQMDD